MAVNVSTHVKSLIVYHAHREIGFVNSVRMGRVLTTGSRVARPSISQIVAFTFLVTVMNANQDTSSMTDIHNAINYVMWLIVQHAKELIQQYVKLVNQVIS